MPERYLRPMEAGELKRFYKLIKSDFAPGEYAPYGILYRQLKKGDQEGLVFCEGESDLAYSICVANKDNNCVLISLFAVLEAYRGQGIGTDFLKAICEKYSKKKAILVEVERPELAETAEERILRSKRIRFYEKEGFQLITGIDYVIWGVPLHLMALPLEATMDEIRKEIKQLMHDIYYPLIGRLFINKLVFR